MRLHARALGVVPPSVAAKVKTLNPTCTQLAQRARTLQCGKVARQGSAANKGAVNACKNLRAIAQHQGCVKSTGPNAGTGDLVAAVLNEPWNPLRGVGDLVPGTLNEPYNPFRGMGCASCGGMNEGMGDLSTVWTDLSGGNFSQAWTDLQSYMTTLSPTFGQYIIPVAGIGILALAVMGTKKAKGRRR